MEILIFNFKNQAINCLHLYYKKIIDNTQGKYSFIIDNTQDLLLSTPTLAMNNKEKAVEMSLRKRISQTTVMKKYKLKVLALYINFIRIKGELNRTRFTAATRKYA